MTNQQQQYQPPLINREFKFKKSISRLASGFSTVLHALLPHEAAKEAGKKFDEGNITSEDDYLLTTAQDIYKDSVARIDALEEKAFKLLTYISAISAIALYFLSTENKGLFTVSIFTALFFLFLAILISLRCIGIKTQRAMYIDAIFTFDNINNPPINPPVTKSKKYIIATLINYAVFNMNVGDNTADLLRAARIMLSLGIMAAIFSSVLYLKQINRTQDKVSKVEVSISDSTFLKQLDNHFYNIDRRLEGINSKMEHISTLKDSLQKK